MALVKQIMELTPAGVDTKSDPKTMAPGRLVVGDNVQAIRHAGAGIELRKRYGFSALTRNTLTGSISKCVTGAEYGNELVLCDGLELYTYSSILQKWIPKGRHQTIACDVDIISGDESSANISGFGTVAGTRPNVDVAIFGNYRATCVSFDQTSSPSLACKVYIRDATTGAFVGNINLGGIYRAKLAVLGSSMFVFGSSFGNLVCARIDLADPTQVANTFNAATDQDHSGFDVFDAYPDSAHNVVWLAYNNNAGHLTIKSVTPASAIGVSSTYSPAWLPYYAISFLSWDFSNSRGYIGLGVTSAGPVASARVIEFNTSTGAETADTDLGGTGGNFGVDQIVGYRTVAGKIGVFFYTRDRASDWRQSYTTADFDGTQYNFMFGAAPNGRAFKIGTKWYVPMAIGIDEDGSRSILMEADEGAISANGPVSICGLIQSQDATGRSLSTGFVSNCPVSGNTVLLGLPSVINRAATGSQINDQRYGASMATFDFSGAGLSAPALFNGVLHLASAAHKTYDGKSVFEAMFYADGPALTGLGSDAAGGGLVAGGTYQYCTTVSRVDSKGRLVRSAPGPISTVTIGLGDDEMVGDVFYYPFTESDPYYNEDQNVSPLNLEIWRTEDGLDVFYLDQVATNDASASSAYTLHFFDQTSDADLVLNEELYTGAGDLDNVKAPAVKALDVWQERLFALTGDGSIWPSKKSFEGFGAEFSDATRILVDDRGGKPIALCHVDQTAVILKRDAAYLLQGDGPDDKGANVFPSPVRMSADLGIVSVNSHVAIDSGELIQTAKGMFTLDRSLAWEAVEGTEGYLSTMTIAGGSSLSSRHMAIAITNDRVLVRDYLFGVWLSWTNTASLLAGVAAARWMNNAAIFNANGVVWVETPGQYFDGSSMAINERIDFGYFCPKNGRVYQMNFVGDWQASTTLSETTTFDYDTGTAETKTRAITAADKTALAVVPSRGRFNAITVSLQETSTTEGFRLSRVDIEWGAKSGLKKSGNSKFFR